MKKILLAVTAALAITGCSQNEEFDAQSQKAEMTFNTAVSKSVRAAEAAIGDLQTNGYKLYAYNTGGSVMADATSLGTAFIDQAATYSGGWTLPGGPYYWTLDENYQFFAYSPKTVISGWDATGKYPSFDFTVKDVAEQEDLLAVAVYDKKKTAATPAGDISLVFKHILTQVNFKLKGGDTGFDYNVTGITINNVLPTGKYTFNANQGSWAASGTPASYTYAATYTKFSDQSELVIATGLNSLMLMPQPVTSIIVTVTYTTSKKGEAGLLFNGSKEVTLTGSPWGVGQKILYTVTLPSGNEAMNIVPSVDGWNNADTGTTN